MKRACLLVMLLLSFGDILLAQQYCEPNFIPFRKGSKWGFCDSMRRIIIKPFHDRVKIINSQIVNGFNETTGKCTVYDKRGRQIIELEGEPEFYRTAYAQIRKNGSNGIMDSTGKIIIQPEFKGSFSAFKEGVTICYMDFARKSVVFDSLGHELFSIDSAFVSDFYKGYAFVIKYVGKSYAAGYRVGVTDKRGKIRWFTEAYMYAEYKSDQGLLTVQKENDPASSKINYSGKTIIPPDYDCQNHWGPEYYFVERMNKKGIIDTSGKSMAPAEYDYIDMVYIDYPVTTGNRKVSKKKKVFILQKDNLSRMIDSTGKEIIPLKYGFIRFEGEGMFRVSQGGKIGYINIEGKIIVPPRFEDCGSFHNGMTWVKEKGKFRLINLEGKFITSEYYDGAQDTGEWIRDSMMCVTINKKQGFVDVHGKIVVPLIYEQAYIGNRNLILVQKDSLWGIRDIQGNEILAPAYSHFSGFIEGYSWVTKKGNNLILDSLFHEHIPANDCIFPRKYGTFFSYGYSDVIVNGKRTFVNTEGQVLQAWLIYDDVRIKDGYFIVTKEKKHGILDEKERVIIPLKYQYVSETKCPRIYRVKLNDQYGYVNVNGTEYFED